MTKKAFLIILFYILPLYCFAQNNESHTVNRDSTNHFENCIDKDMLLGKNVNLKAEKWHQENGKYLLIEVYKAFNNMKEAAAKEGINIKVRSGFRSFNHQTWIWNWKWGLKSRIKMTPKEKAVDILKYSSMPGTSRHHWGTEADINSLELEYWESEEGEKIYKWLCENAEQFGFFQPFKNNEGKGYLVEKWHWSYSAIATKFYTKYLKTIKYEDIKDFMGYEQAEELEILEKWVKLD